MSATVQKAIEAVEAADAKVPASPEVKAEENVTDAERKKAAKATAKKIGVKKATTGKYAAAEKAQAKRAEALRGKARSVGPVQVIRVREGLGKRKPLDVLDMPITKAKAFAGGDTSVTASDSLTEFSATMTDPFCRGRGAAAILLALHESEKK